MIWSRVRMKSAVLAIGVLLAIGVAFAVAADASTSQHDDLYTIEGTLKIPRTSKPTAAKVYLNGGLYIALVKGDGSFAIRDVPVGTYVLEVSSIDYVFSPVRIDISAKERKIKASSVVTRMGATGPIKQNERMSHPLQLRPVSSAEYFQKRAPYNVWGIFKNPMVLMIGVTLIMVVVFPRLMNNMSPEEKEEMQRMQSQMSFSNLLQGKFPSTDAPADGAITEGDANGGGGGGAASGGGRSKRKPKPVDALD